MGASASGGPRISTRPTSDLSRRRYCTEINMTHLERLYEVLRITNRAFTAGYQTGVKPQPKYPNIELSREVPYSK